MAKVVITAVYPEADVPGVPEAWFRVSVDGEQVLANPARPRANFVSFAAAEAAALSAAGVAEAPWSEQYDSTLAVALNQPAAFVAFV